jgi:hypothetical protein
MIYEGPTVLEEVVARSAEEQRAVGDCFLVGDSLDGLQLVSSSRWI